MDEVEEMEGGNVSLFNLRTNKQRQDFWFSIRFQIGLLEQEVSKLELYMIFMMLGLKRNIEESS